MSARNMLGTHYLDIYQPSSKITLEAWHEGDPLIITKCLNSIGTCSGHQIPKCIVTGGC